MLNWTPINLDLEITTRCNLHCKYCYLNKHPLIDKGDMSIEVANLVLKYMHKIKSRIPPSKHIQICFFGGEPFLNFDIVQYLTLNILKQKIPTRFAIFTNGATATEAQINWCKKYNIRAKRSVGGCPEACELTRPGDYLQKYHEETKLWNDWGGTRRITIIPEIAQYIMKSVQYFHNKGYYGAFDFTTDNYVEWSKVNINHYKEQITLLAKEVVRQFFMGNVLAIITFNAMAKKYRNNNVNMGCGAGWGLQGITWDGNIVPCHRMFREPIESPMYGGRLSNVLDGIPFVFGNELYSHILDCRAKKDNEKCQACIAKTICHHGCRHVNWCTSRNLYATPQVHCIFMKHIYKTVKWIHSQIGHIDESWYTRLPTKSLLINVGK